MTMEWGRLIEQAMAKKPGTVTHMNITHKSYCMSHDGEICNCKAEVTERKVN